MLALLFLLFQSISSGNLSDEPVVNQVTGNLSHSSVTSITQDSLGFVWVGTRYGLNRFKGGEFDNFLYMLDDSSTILNSNITNLVRDTAGNIWIASSGGGVTYYNTYHDTFKRYINNPRDKNSLASNYVNTICLLKNGNLLMGTSNDGLSLLNTAENRFYHFKHNPIDKFSLSSNHISSINVDRDQNIWVGTWDAGVNRFDLEKGKFYRYDMDKSGNSAKIIRSIEDLGGQLYIGTNGGLFSVVKTSDDYAFKKLLTNHPDISDKPIISMIRDSKQGFWLGTENFGIFYFESGWDKPVNIMNNNSVWSIFEDDVGIIWIGTYKNGLYKYDEFENRFNHVKYEANSENTLSYNVVSTFLEDKASNLWIGTDGGGLNYLDRKTNKFTVYLHDPEDQSTIASNAVLDLAMHQNDLWVATWRGGVSVKKENENYFTHFNSSNGLLGNNIYDLMVDDKNQIWISSFREGINIYNPVAKEFSYLRFDDIGSNKVRKIFQDHQGYVWLGTEGDGLLRIKVGRDNTIVDKKHFVTDYVTNSAAAQYSITYLYETEDQNLWIGTEGSGLSQIDLSDYNVTSYTTNEGLSSNVVYGVIKDRHGTIWVSTGRGLNRLNLSSGEVRVYDRSDGLQSLEFFKSACYKTFDDELFFGGINGYNHFRPNDIGINKNVPRVYLTGLKVNNADYQVQDGRNITLVKEIELDHSENDLLFSFYALNYSQPEKTNYQYKLSGFDEDWRSSRDRKEVNYTNIPPGRYSFMVKASNNDGLWNEDGTSLSITINKPWWKTVYAYFTYLMLAGLVVWRGRQNIVNRERLKNDLKIEHLEVVRMREIDSLKNKFFTNISHDFKTPLTLILEPLKSINEKIQEKELKGQLRIVMRNAERLFRLINRLLEISKLESKVVTLKAAENDLVNVVAPVAFSFNSYADRLSINFKCEFPDERILMFFEKDKIEKVVLNLLSNAFKFTPEYGEVKFSLAKKDDAVELCVKDNGIGISTEDQPQIFDRFYRVANDNSTGTGVGLALVREIIDLHKGSVEVISVKEQGTTFIVTLPLGREHLKTNEIVDNYEVSPYDEQTEDFYIDIGNSIDDYSAFETRYDTGSTSEFPLILVVEDNIEMRSYICKYLESSYRLVEAEHGEKGVQLAQDLIPDLVISDVAMPGFSGFDLCEAVKNDERTSHIPIILLTGKSAESDMQTGFKYGADYFITKPFNSKLLELQISNILQSRDRIRSKVLDDHSSDVKLKEGILAPKDKVFIDKVVACIEQNISESDFQIDNLCTTIGMSRVQLYRKLKGTVGQSANEFIRTIRLKKAAQLLHSSELTIAEVTYDVGFTDLHYFRVAFKKQFGVNPSQYREKAL